MAFAFPKVVVPTVAFSKFSLYTTTLAEKSEIDDINVNKIKNSFFIKVNFKKSILVLRD